MRKYITKVLFLLCMTTPAFTQNYTLVVEGFEHIKIGDSLDTSKVKSVKNNTDFSEIRFWSSDKFDYYYVASVDEGITIDSSILVKDIFIGTTKKNTIEGFILLIEKKYEPQLTVLLNKVFGGQKLESSSSSEIQGQRVKKFWVKDSIKVFATISNSNYIRLTISLRQDDGNEPDLSMPE
jgi:hypothetical protein